MTSNGEFVGHIPREILRVTKYFLDHGAIMLVELTSKQYRCSTQVQGEMEIACLVTVKMPAILKNTKVQEK